MEIIDLIIKPDPEEPGAAEVLLAGSLDGRPVTFLLDTGAAHSNLAWDDFTSRYQAIDEAESSGLFSRSQYDVVEVESLSLGSYELRDVKLHRQRQASAHSRNLIGMDLLKHHRCIFDFNEERVVLDPPQDMVEANFLNELIMDDRAHPYIQLHLDSIQAQATWDTGAGVTVVDERFIQQNAAFFEEGTPSQGTDSSGTTRETPMYRMNGTVIGNHEFAAHRVAAVDLGHINSQIERPMDMILGYTTLQQANWYFDFPGRSWAITKML